MKIEIGSGVLIVFTCILAILKVTGCLTMSWMWVFSPIWFPFIILLSVFMFVLLLVFLAVLIRIIINCV